MTGETFVSYRDYMEEQRKLAKTKKEAREAKKERLRNPRPPRLDPPPAADVPIFLIAAGVFLALAALWSLVMFAIPTVGTPADEDPTVVIQGTPVETAAIGAWLEEEIQASNLHWKIIAVRNPRELADHLNAGGRMDVLIVDQDLAEELYAAGMLAPLLHKTEAPSFAGCYAPLWEEKPFIKTLGWAVAAMGDVAYARHLFTVVQQFAPPFNLEAIFQTHAEL